MGAKYKTKDRKTCIGSISLLFALALLVALPCVSWGWDCFYDGSVLPNDPSLGTKQWYCAHGDLAQCSTDGNILRIGDTYINYLDFYRRATGGPITMEARIRVTGESESSVFMCIGTNSFTTLVMLYPGCMEVSFDYGGQPVTYSADLTTFHTFRIAINAQGQSYTWLDQTLVAQGVTHVGGQGFVDFGSLSEGGLGQSYWDYVAYSQAFLPVPEPASLLALCAGLIPLAFRRRRRR